jgi:hypothetical protein
LDRGRHVDDRPNLLLRGAVVNRYTSVVEMISGLPDPLNAWGGPVKLYRPAAISYISIYNGLVGPSELKESSSKLNIRDVAEQGVAGVDIGMATPEILSASG